MATLEPTVPLSRGAGDGSNLPEPSGAGQIPVSTEGGEWAATDAGNVKVGSLAATGDVSSARVMTDRVEVESTDGQQAATTTPETASYVDDDTGNRVEVAAAGITIETVAESAVLTADIVAALENTNYPLSAANPVVDGQSATEGYAAIGLAIAAKADTTDARFPTTDQKAALAGTSGTAPSALNKLVDAADPRVSIAYLLAISDMGVIGRFEVLPAFYQTGSTPGSHQLNGANKGIGMKFVAPCTCAPASLSFHVGTVASAGVLSVAIYDLTAGVNYSCGNTASISATGWFRHTFTAVQLYENHQYEIRLTWVSGDVSLTYHRVLPEPGHEFPESCEGFSTTDNWASEVGLTVSDREALPNFVLGSNASHCPQLVFSGFGSVAVFDATSALVSPAPPTEGLFVDCSSLTADTLYYLYGYSNEGVLAIEISETAPVSISGGMECKGPADSTRRFLGMVVPHVLISTSVGPVMVPDRLHVANINPKRRIIGKRAPYYATTTETVTATTWRSWRGDSDDYKIDILVCKTTLLAAKSVIGSAASSYGITAVGLNGKAAISHSVVGPWNNGGMRLSACRISLKRGQHYLYPLLRKRSDAGTSVDFAYYHRDGVDIANQGVVMGIIEC